MRTWTIRFSAGLSLVVFGFVVALSCPAANWPGWRGIGSMGLSREKSLPTKWSSTENVRWKVALQGAGVSAPTVWGEQIYLTSSEGRLNDRLHVWCYHRGDGRLLWHTRLFGSALPDGLFPPGGMAVPTPAADGQRVYALFGTGDLVCLDTQGKPVWIRSLAHEYGPFRNRWGMASSPLLAGESLIVQVDHWGGSYLLSVDPATGATRWRTPRNAAVNWTSPVLATVKGQKQIITAGTHQIKGYDLARGNELWSITALEMQCIPTPVVQEDVLYGLSGPITCTLAVRLDGAQGDLTDSHILWKGKSGAATIPSPLVLGGEYYYVEDTGMANCLNARTGAKLWRERLGGGKYHASPVAGADRVYFASLDGIVTVIKPGPKFEVLGRNKLDENIVASPALADGQIFIRGEQHLFCIEEKKK